MQDKRKKPEIGDWKDDNEKGAGNKNKGLR
jgi:hypothetical protein